MNKIKSDGFSLIEVLVAMAIVAMIAVVSLPLFSMGLRNIQSSGEDTLDLYSIQSEIETDDKNNPQEGKLILDLKDKKLEIEINYYELNENNNISLIYFESIK